MTNLLRVAGRGGGDCTGIGAMWLCLGSTWLCLGTAKMMKSREDEKQSNDEEENPCPK